MAGGSGVSVAGGSGVSVSGGGLWVLVGLGVFVSLGVFVASGVSVGTGVSVSTSVGGSVGSSVALGTGVKLAAGVFDTEVTKGDGLLPGVGVSVLVPLPVLPPSDTRVWVRNTGSSVRVGVAVLVTVVVGVKVSVGPVIGNRNAKKDCVGPAVGVGVKNIIANACWVIALSAEMGVGVYLGWSTSYRISGAPPYTMNGSRSAKNATTARVTQVMNRSVCFLLFTGDLCPAS